MALFMQGSGAGGDSDDYNRDQFSGRGPKERRKLVPAACRMCQKRKQRCNAQRPKCDGCVRSGTSCEYETQAGETRQDAIKRQKREAQLELVQSEQNNYDSIYNIRPLLPIGTRDRIDTVLLRCTDRRLDVNLHTDILAILSELNRDIPQQMGIAVPPVALRPRTTLPSMIRDFPISPGLPSITAFSAPSLPTGPIQSLPPTNFISRSLQFQYRSAPAVTVRYADDRLPWTTLPALPVRTTLPRHEERDSASSTYLRQDNSGSPSRPYGNDSVSSRRARQDVAISSGQSRIASSSSRRRSRM